MENNNSKDIEVNKQNDGSKEEVESNKCPIEDIENLNLTDKSINEIKILEEKLNELDETIIKDNEASYDLPSEAPTLIQPGDTPLENQPLPTTNVEENEDSGEISLEPISSTDVEIKEKIAQIKSELNAELTLKDKIRNFFKPKKQKIIEKQLIENKAIELNKNKKNVKYVQTDFKSTIGLFSVFYSRNDMTWRIMIAIFAGLIMGLVSFIFVQNTGVVITGMSGIFQGISRIVRVFLFKNQESLNLDSNKISSIYTAMFYGTYLLANIPLIIFSYKKIGKNFTILSTIVVLVSNILPMLLNLIPNSDSITIFGKTISTEYAIEHTNQSANLVEKPSDLYKYGVNILTFINGNFTFPNSNVTTTILDAPKFVSMFLYVLCAGVVNGFAIAMNMAIGGSTGGLDFISFFFAYKKNKSLKTLLISFNIVSVFLTTMLGSYISAIIANPAKYTGYEYFFSQNLLTGFIYAFLLSVMVSNLFPKDKVVKIGIYSSKVVEIRNYLYSKNFNHSLTINTTTGGYSMSQQQNIEIICMFMEIPRILEQLRSCDKYALITITNMKGIDGKLMVESAIN